MQILLCGDCRNIDPAKVGHSVMGTDPPYSEHTHTAAVSKGPGNTILDRNFGFEHLTPELQAYLTLACATSERWSLVYCDLESAGDWARCVPRKIRTVACVDEPPDSMPWIRWVMGAPGGGRPPQCAEAVVLGHSARAMSWGGPDNLQALAHKSERHRDKHKTEKPLDQALDLVAWFSDPGELWYDPCSGRGTFGVACALLGREYLGCELQADEAAKAQARIAGAQGGVLSVRDSERFHRWAKSIGHEGVQDVRSFQGARFKKGRPC